MRSKLPRLLVSLTVVIIGVTAWLAWRDYQRRVYLESPKHMLHDLWGSLEIAKELRCVDADGNGIGEYCGVEALWKNHLGTGDLPRPDGSIEILKAGPDPIWRSGTVPDWLMCVQVPRGPAQAEKHYRVVLWPRYPVHHPVAIIGTETTLPKSVYVQPFDSFGVEAFSSLRLPEWGAGVSQYGALGWSLKPVAELPEN